MKRIAYLIVDNGSDGRGPISIVKAFWDENKRDLELDNNINKCYYRKEERIVDVKKSYALAISKLNPIDRLVVDSIEHKEEL